jgi:hypothetical protein
MRRLMLVLAFVSTAATADAARLALTFDGQVNQAFGSGPSLTSLGLTYGTPLHYEVLVDTGAGAFYTANGNTFPLVDQWFAPDHYETYFRAELLAQPYATPGSYYGWGREFFAGLDIVSPAFEPCAILGRLVVGTELLQIDGCGAVSTWAAGTELGSSHIWQDPTTGQTIYVYGSLTVTEVVPLPEPAAAGPAALLVALLARLRSSSRA